MTFFFFIPNSTMDSQAHHSNMDIEQKEITDILTRTAANLHTSTYVKNAPTTFSIVHNANNSETHKELDRILASHFYSLNLSNYQSVIVFLLLNFFLMKREKNKEKELLKKLYEDHASILKKKISDLEDKVLKESEAGKVCSELLSSRNCSSCVELIERLEEMTTQVSQLQQSHDEVRQMNV